MTKDPINKYKRQATKNSYYNVYLTKDLYLESINEFYKSIKKRQFHRKQVKYMNRNFTVQDTQIINKYKFSNLV